MGNCKVRRIDTYDPSSPVDRSHFAFRYIINTSRYGYVWKVDKKSNDRSYALKQMDKRLLLHKRSIEQVLNERRILSMVRHPFITNMNYAFQDAQNLYLATDLVAGGDLEYHFSKKRKFTEEQAKFVMANVIIALEYLHSQGVLHRNLTPRSIIFDSRGYIKLTDFGFARFWQKNNSQDISGTPGFMAPEIMFRQNHGVISDFFAIGVIGYIIMIGRPPYPGSSRREVKEQLKNKQIQIKKNEIPEGWSLESADFVNKCLQRKPDCRLGLNGINEVKQHVWLREYDWGGVAQRKMPPPFVPKLTLLRKPLFSVYVESKAQAEKNRKERQIWEEDEEEIEERRLVQEEHYASMFFEYFYDTDKVTEARRVQEEERKAKQKEVQANFNNRVGTTNSTPQKYGANTLGF